MRRQLTICLLILVSLLFGLLPFLKALPLKYQQKDNTVILENVSSKNPVIYDNDWWTDVPDAAYIWGKASLGECNLRGNIITRCTFDWRQGYAHQWEEQTKDFDRLWKASEKSGLKHVPKVTFGAQEALQKPRSGVLKDTKFRESAGSQLIVAEAKRATAEKPLLIFCGGSCTTIATAFLHDPTIVDRVIVFQVDGGGYNGSDQWAWEITIQHFRFVNWARGYFWDKLGVWDATPFQKLPENPLGDLLREYASSNLAKANQWGDGAWIYQLYDPKCLTKVEVYDRLAITVPKDATHREAMSAEFFKTMMDSKMYHPK